MRVNNVSPVAVLLSAPGTTKGQLFWPEICFTTLFITELGTRLKTAHVFTKF